MQSGFPDGQLHSSLCEREREISSNYPAGKIKTQWGFGSQDTLHANYFILSGALYSIMKGNSRILKNIFLSEPLGDFVHHLMYSCVCTILLVCALDSFSQGEIRPAITVRERIVALLSHNSSISVGQTPSSTAADTSSDIKRLCRSEVTKTVTSNWDMNKNLSQDISQFPAASLYLIPVGDRVSKRQSGFSKFYFACVCLVLAAHLGLCEQSECCLNSAVCLPLVCPTEYAAILSKWQQRKSLKVRVRVL